MKIDEFHFKQEAFSFVQTFAGLTVRLLVLAGIGGVLYQVYAGLAYLATLWFKETL